MRTRKKRVSLCNRPRNQSTPWVYAGDTTQAAISLAQLSGTYSVLVPSIRVAFGDFPSTTGFCTFRYRKYYWRGMAGSVQGYVSWCKLYRHKYARDYPARLLHPLGIFANHWTDIDMDFMSQLPLTASDHDAVLWRLERTQHHKLRLAFSAISISDLTVYQNLSCLISIRSSHQSSGRRS